MSNDYKVLPVGFGNSILAHRVVSIIRADSAPMKRLRQEARENRRLLDLTEGRKTRSLILLDTNHIVLSAVQVETLVTRMNSSELMADEDFAEEDDVEDS